MKTLLLILVLILLTAINLNAKTIKEGDTEYTCNPVKTCDEKLQQAYAEIKRLKQQIKKPIYKTEIKTITKEIPIEKRIYITQEKTKIKKHIISLVLLPSVIDVYAEKTSPNTAKAEAIRSYGLGAAYQYQFDNGIVPLLGVTLVDKIKPIIGVGYEF